MLTQYKPETINQLADAANEIMISADMREFKDFLFELQNELIAGGFFETATKEYMEDVAAYFSFLHVFFSRIDQISEAIS